MSTIFFSCFYIYSCTIVLQFKNNFQNCVCESRFVCTFFFYFKLLLLLPNWTPHAKRKNVLWLVWVHSSYLIGIYTLFVDATIATVELYGCWRKDCWSRLELHSFNESIRPNDRLFCCICFHESFGITFQYHSMQIYCGNTSYSFPVGHVAPAVSITMCCHPNGIHCTFLHFVGTRKHCGIVWLFVWSMRHIRWGHLVKQFQIHMINIYKA